jgi:hypothetical protein
MIFNRLCLIGCMCLLLQPGPGGGIDPQDWYK